jgi:hypothetical protein
MWALPAAADEDEDGTSEAELEQEVEHLRAEVERLRELLEAALPALTGAPPAASEAGADPSADEPDPGEPGAASDEEASEWDDASAWDDDEGLWESDAVEPGIQLSGVVQASARWTLFPGDEDELAEDHFSFQLDHNHMKVIADVTGRLSVEITPCLTHMDRFSILSAFFEYEVVPALHITGGRFLLPFGGFNLDSLPGSFVPVSRPLLYQSHEDRYIGFPFATPQNLAFTPRDDLGLMLSGSTWFGPMDLVQFWYGVYLTNGPRPDSYTMARHWEDNNNAKAVGGRAVFSLDWMPIDVAVGGSALVNRYRDNETEALWGKLDQVMWSTDIEFGLRWAPGRRLVIKGEFSRSHHEIIPNDELASGDATIDGWYLQANTMVADWLAVYAQVDQLRNRIPRALGNETFRDEILRTNRVLAGLNFIIDDALEIKTEYSYWDHRNGQPDAHRVNLQSILAF